MEVELTTAEMEGLKTLIKFGADLVVCNTFCKCLPGTPDDEEEIAAADYVTRFLQQKLGPNIPEVCNTLMNKISDGLILKLVIKDDVILSNQLEFKHKGFCCELDECVSHHPTCNKTDIYVCFIWIKCDDGIERHFINWLYGAEFDLDVGSRVNPSMINLIDDELAKHPEWQPADMTDEFETKHWRR